jgi:xanthine dehydrogenase/oxidase
METRLQEFISENIKKGERERNRKERLGKVPSFFVILVLQDVGSKNITCPSTGLACRGTCHQSHEGQIAVPNPPRTGASPVWYQPTSRSALYQQMSALAGKKIFYVAGHTSLGVYDDGPYDAEINTKKVPELYEKTSAADKVVVGANVTMTDIIDFFNETAAAFPQFLYLGILARHVTKIAGMPVRNVSFNN